MPYSDAKIFGLSAAAIKLDVAYDFGSFDDSLGSAVAMQTYKSMYDLLSSMGFRITLDADCKHTVEPGVWA